MFKSKIRKNNENSYSSLPVLFHSYLNSFTIFPDTKSKIIKNLTEENVVLTEFQNEKV